MLSLPCPSDGCVTGPPALSSFRAVAHGPGFV